MPAFGEDYGGDGDDDQDDTGGLSRAHSADFPLINSNTK